jgi:ABC-type lipoprotein release transport system permease subunit
MSEGMKSNINIGGIAINFIGLLTMVFYVGGFKSNIESHINDAAIHMDMTTKMELFVPRSELKVTLENMADDLEDIKKIIYSQYGNNE